MIVVYNSINSGNSSNSSNSTGTSTSCCCCRRSLSMHYINCLLLTVTFAKGRNPSSCSTWVRIPGRNFVFAGNSTRWAATQL